MLTNMSTSIIDWLYMAASLPVMGSLMAGLS